MWIPFDGKALPAWFHLPPGYSGGRIPVVVFVPGMDSFKEASVWLYGDPNLNRGFAVLAMEGPGQYECPTLGIYMTMEGWEATGKACMDWLLQRPEVDPERIALSGRSFGSFGAHAVRGRGRAALSRLRGERDLPRARLAHDLPGGLAHLQDALHVHGELHRRGEVRRVPQDR